VIAGDFNIDLGFLIELATAWCFRIGLLQVEDAEEAA
jgi:hypothetical protein